MTTTFTKKHLAVESAPIYSEKIRDDVYVLRSARGNEWRLVARAEMLEFKSCYIEHYQRYSPREKALSVIMKFLQGNDIVGGSMTTDGKTITVKTEDKTFKIELHEDSN